MVEQVPPTATWGKTFITCPIAGQTAYDLFKVIASRDDSTVSISCTDRPLLTLHLQNGEFAAFNISSTSHCYISSDEPILLVQHSIASSVDVFEGDPFMVIVPPIEQYGSNYSITTLSTAFQGAPESYYINILLPEGVSPSGVRLNNLPLGEGASFTSVPCGSRQGFCGSSAQVRISHGQHMLTHENASAVFNAIVYWISFRTGSGYFAGMRQNPTACMSTIA